MKEIIVVFCCCAHFINNDVPCRFLHHGKHLQRYIFFYKIVLQKLETSLFCLRIQIKCSFCCLQKAIKQTGSIDLSMRVSWGASLFPCSLPFLPYVPMFPQLFLICSLTYQLTTYPLPSIPPPPQKIKTTQKKRHSKHK